MSDQILLLFGAEKLANLEPFVAYNDSDTRAIPGVLRRFHLETREESRIAINTFGPLMSLFDDQFVDRERQHFLLAGAAHAIVQTAEQRDHFERTKRQYQPIATHCERRCDCRGHRQQRTDEIGIGAPGPGALRAQNDLTFLDSIVEVRRDHIVSLTSGVSRASTVRL